MATTEGITGLCAFVLFPPNWIYIVSQVINILFNHTSLHELRAVVLPCNTYLLHEKWLLSSFAIKYHGLSIFQGQNMKEKKHNLEPWLQR